jgi:hypothetical protein
MGKVHRIDKAGSSSDPFLRRLNREITGDQYARSLDDRLNARRAADARELQRAKKTP